MYVSPICTEKALRERAVGEMGRENKESTGQNCQQDTRHQSYDTNNGVSDNKPGQRDRCGSAGNPHFSLKLCQEYSKPIVIHWGYENLQQALQMSKAAYNINFHILLHHLKKKCSVCKCTQF